MVRTRRVCIAVVTLIALGATGVSGQELVGSASSQPSAAAAASVQAAPPRPESILGFRPGDDFRLARYDESIAYFQALAAASDRIRMVEVGRTSDGQRWWMALISSPENLARVEEYREIARRLARPGDLADAEARELAARGKALVHIDGGLHATEVAHAQHTIQLAYDLVSDRDDPEIQAILDEVILMLWPSVNPDGQNMVVDWYRGNVGGPYEIAPLPSLYQRYVGHDNNRDAYMLNMVESRVLARAWRHWEPQIVYVHHQSSPFPTRIWLPPFAEPIAPRVHPLMSRTVNAIGMLIAQALEERGQPGAVHMGTGFDAWYPGYVDYMPMLRNVAAWWTETALHAYATPKFYTLQDFPSGRRDLRSESLYPSPWQGGWWRLRDAVEYMLTASIATLDYAAKFRSDLLYNRYQAARGTTRRYTEEPPFAYFVPQEQRDPVAAVELLRRLAFNGVRVARLREAVEHEGVRHVAGTWVIPMAQEDAELARQVLEIQTYPDLREYPEGPPEQPYDAAGWTLSIQMGVRVIGSQTPLESSLLAALEPVVAESVEWEAGADEPSPETDPARDAAPFDSVPGVGFDTDPVAAAIVPPSGTRTGNGPALVLDPAHNNAFRALNRAWDSGATVGFRSGDGRWTVEGLTPAAIDAIVADLALRAENGPAGTTAVARPRIGLYRPWTASMDEGWTRWVLERYGFEHASVYDGDVRGGGLRDRFDVLVLPDISARSIVSGHASGRVPPRYAGGIGRRGAAAIDRFVRDGGTLVAFNAATLFAIEELGLPLRNAVDELDRDEFFAGISLLRVDVDTAHPVMAGMPERAAVTVSRSPVFETDEGFGGTVLMSYPDNGSALLSGYLLGPEHLRGRAAAVDVPHGDGRVVLLGFRPQWRGQSFGTFRVIFNALLYSPSLAPAGGAEANEAQR